MAEVKIYAIDVQIFLDDADLYKDKLLKMSVNRQDAIKKYKKKEVRALSVGAGTVIKYAFDEYIKKHGLPLKSADLTSNKGCKDKSVIEEPVLAYGEYGKPYFKNYPDFKFNVSHSGTIAICAVSDTEIGCDIELIRDINLNILRKVLSKEEQRAFENKDSFGLEKSSDCNSLDRKLKLFYTIWTAKESTAKALGRGLSIDFSGFSVLDKGYDKVINKEKLLLKQVYIKDGYVAAVCIKQDKNNNDVNIDIKWIER